MSTLLPRHFGPLVGLLGALSGLCAAGCGPQTRGPAQIQIDTLPLHKDHLATLFDDSIEPAAMGLNMEKVILKIDPKFRDRVREADVLAAVKVTTVTVGKIEERSIIHIQFSTEQVFSPSAPEAEHLELRIPEGTQAYGVMQAVQNKARNRSLVGAWKRFRSGNEAVIHFYFAPNDADTIAAIKEIQALREINK